MSFKVRELQKAKADKRHIFEWLYERSPIGASAWLAAYDELVERLKTSADSFADASEQADLDMNLREALFKSRAGRLYRALFVVRGDEVFILRVRGPGQAPVEAEDLERP